MGLHETSTVRQEIKDIRVFGMPLGPAILALSRLSQDEQTQTTLTEAKLLTEAKGLMILESHRSEWDIMAVTAQLAANLPIEEVAGFIAAKWSSPKNPIGSAFFKEVNSKPHLNLIPVVRGEDEAHVTTDRFTARYDTNADSIDIMRNFLTGSKSLGVVAPYGSRERFLQREKIRRGAVELARDFPSICSLAVFKPERRGYVIKLSAILTFSQTDTDPEIKDALQEQFAELLAVNSKQKTR